MKYTPTEATKAVKGLNRKRIYDMMNNGEISYEEAKWGKKSRRYIDASELIRNFGDDFKPDVTEETGNNVTMKQIVTTQEQEGNADGNIVLQERIQVRDEKIEDLKETITEIKQDRDNWRDQANKLLLSSPITTQDTVKEKLSTTMILSLFFILGLVTAFITYMTKIYWMP